MTYLVAILTLTAFYAIYRWDGADRRRKAAEWERDEAICKAARLRNEIEAMRYSPTKLNPKI